MKNNVHKIILGTWYLRINQLEEIDCTLVFLFVDLPIYVEEYLKILKLSPLLSAYVTYISFIITIVSF